MVSKRLSVEYITEKNTVRFIEALPVHKLHFNEVIGHSTVEPPIVDKASEYQFEIKLEGERVRRLPLFLWIRS